MKIGIISACFGRLEVLRIFCAGIKRLRAETGMDIPCVVSGDNACQSILESYNITFLEYPNNPLTSKFNNSCEALKEKVDYVMVMGSDNLISTSAFLSVVAEAEKGTDLIGFDSIYFLGMDEIFSGDLVFFRHSTVLGVGRTVRARVLDNVNWHPYGQDRNRGIDCVMLDSCRPYVRSSVLISNQFLVDMKTSMNLNKISFWHRKLGKLPSNKLLFDNIGEEEAELIRQYIGKA